MAKMIDLKEFRKKWGLTQIVCAKETGVSLQAWQLWERGANKPGLENWEKLQKFLAQYKEDE